jgi:predicted ATP-grasp superfamily ATP-dependent carboligase
MDALDTTHMDALVTAAHIPSSVSGLRALGRAGLQVVATAPRWAAAGLWSRHASARALVPEPEGDPDGFLEAIGTLAERHGPLVIYPGEDDAVNLLVEARERLPERAIVPYPGQEALAAVRDKRRLAELASESGLMTPRTLITGLAGQLAAGELPDGAVVKTAQPGRAFHEPVVAGSAEEVRVALAAAPADEELLLQERVAGPLMALAVVVGRDGALVRRFQQVASRVWPEPAGPSRRATSVEPDEELAEAARSMLAAAGFWGLAQLQFIATADGPRLIDVNTRYYGSMALALAAGVSLPAAWHDVALNRPAGRPGRYAAGVSYRWLEADLIAALRRYPGSLFPRPPRPCVGPMWARDDLVTSALFPVFAVTGALGRRLRGG